MQIAGIIEWAMRLKHSLPDAFKFYRWECLPHGGETIYYEMEGGVPQKQFKSGPRKGRPNYSTCTDVKVLRVTIPELEAFEKQYMDSTGNCSCCMGQGKTVASVSVYDGTTYKECNQCNGTGKCLVSV